jgi:hypothetical protein
VEADALLHVLARAVAAAPADLQEDPAGGVITFDVEIGVLGPEDTNLVERAGDLTGAAARAQTGALPLDHDRCPLLVGFTARPAWPSQERPRLKRAEDRSTVRLSVQRLGTTTLVTPGAAQAVDTREALGRARDILTASELMDPKHFSNIIGPFPRLSTGAGPMRNMEEYVMDGSGAAAHHTLFRLVPDCPPKRDTRGARQSLPIMGPSSAAWVWPASDLLSKSHVA